METASRSVGSVELCTQKQQFRIWNWLRINLSLSFDAREKGFQLSNSRLL